MTNEEMFNQNDDLKLLLNNRKFTKISIGNHSK